MQDTFKLGRFKLCVESPSSNASLERVHGGVRLWVDGVMAIFDFDRREILDRGVNAGYTIFERRKLVFESERHESGRGTRYDGKF